MTGGGDGRGRGEEKGMEASESGRKAGFGWGLLNNITCCSSLRGLNQMNSK